MQVATVHVLALYPPLKAEEKNITSAINNRRTETNGKDGAKAQIRYNAQLPLGAAKRLVAVPVRITIANGVISDAQADLTGNPVQAYCSANYSFPGASKNKGKTPRWTLALGEAVAADCAKLSEAELRVLANRMGLKLVKGDDKPASTRTRRTTSTSTPAPAATPAPATETAAQKKKRKAAEKRAADKAKQDKAKADAAAAAAAAASKPPASSSTSTDYTLPAGFENMNARDLAIPNVPKDEWEKRTPLTAIPKLGEPVLYMTSAGAQVGIYVGKGESGANKGKHTVRQTAQLRGKVKAVAKIGDLRKPSGKESKWVKPIGKAWKAAKKAQEDAAKASATTSTGATVADVDAALFA